VPVLAAVQRKRRQCGKAPLTSRRVVNTENLKTADLLKVVQDTSKYKELDRQFRRPVYGYKDWVEHRSDKRIFKNLAGIFESRIFRAIWFEVLCPTVVAALVWGYYDWDWQAIASGFMSAATIQSIGSVLPTISITALPFTVASASLSLLLVFKTNAAYSRWWEARKVWGSIVNKTRDIARQSLARIPDSHAYRKPQMCKLSASFPHVLRFHLGQQTKEDAAELLEVLEELLPEEQVRYVMTSTHKPMTLCGIMSETLRDSGLDTLDMLKMDQILSDFADYYGMCERIFKTPIPLSYTRLTGRFLSVWLLFMPFALYTAVSPHWLIIPVTALLSLFIFGIEELGMQIEEPFSVLPLKAISGGIQASILEALDLEMKEMEEMGIKMPKATVAARARGGRTLGAGLATSMAGSATGLASTSSAFAGAAQAATPVITATRKNGATSRVVRFFNPAKGEISAEDVKNADLLAVVQNTQDYKEQDRRFRRPVFGYPDWVKHRSADRFLTNLSTVFMSRIARAIWLEVLSPTVVAFLVLFYYEADWQGLYQSLSLAPSTIESLQALPAFTTSNLPFTLCSPALSLLLVFKTNSAYGRWWEARKVWGSIVNKTRDLVRQAIARISPKQEHLKAEITRLTASFPYILAFHLCEQTPPEVAQLKQKLEELLTQEEADYIMAAVHKPMTVSGMLSDTLQKADLDLFDKLKMDQILSDFADYYGMCERIFKTPIPLSYTRLTARFLSVWMLCLPFALYAAVTPHYLIIPITFFIASFVFGIEELGMQIEEPFSYLPLDKISGGIEASLMEALKLNSTAPLKAVAPEDDPAEVLEEITKIAEAAEAAATPAAATATAAAATATAAATTAAKPAAATTIAFSSKPTSPTMAVVPNAPLASVAVAEPEPVKPTEPDVEKAVPAKMSEEPAEKKKKRCTIM